MNLYSVHIDRDHMDGSNEKGGPPESGKISRLVYRYVAPDIERVWDWHRQLMMEGHDTMVGIIEDASGVSVLSDADGGKPALTPGDERG